MPINNYRNILLVRLSALGDIIFTTSLLDVLRNTFPKARLTWLVQQHFAGIIQEDPRLDNIITVPKSTFSSPGALLQLRRQLRQQQYDLIIDAQGTLKSNLTSALAGPRRIGFAAKKIGGTLLHEVIPKGGDIRDISSEYRFLGNVITGQEAGPPSLKILPNRQQDVLRQMNEWAVRPGFVALSPFTTRPEKHWVEEHWAQLAALVHAAGKQPVIFGGPGREAEAARMADASGAPVINLTGRTQLADLPAWFSMAELVIGVDTGLTHLGIALRRPVVALFGATCPYTQGATSPLKVLLAPPETAAQANMIALTPETVWQEAVRVKGLIE